MLRPGELMANNSKQPGEIRIHGLVADLYREYVAFVKAMMKSAAKKILIVEDETDLVKLLKYNLENRSR